MAFLQGNLSRSLKNKAHIPVFFPSSLAVENLSQRIKKIQISKDVNQMHLLQHYFFGIPVNPSIEERLKKYSTSTQWNIMQPLKRISRDIPVNFKGCFMIYY